MFECGIGVAPHMCRDQTQTELEKSFAIGGLYPFVVVQNYECYFPCSASA
eukprot:GDKH01013374.1.p5 GENE.GDKH01013374.1~~GDKH01013374.1.p5  ORF type:complete len:50 (-),score=5.88 GDKH01013374.1:180-329(-)